MLARLLGLPTEYKIRGLSYNIFSFPRGFGTDDPAGTLELMIEGPNLPELNEGTTVPQADLLFSDSGNGARAEEFIFREEWKGAPAYSPKTVKIIRNRIEDEALAGDRDEDLIKDLHNRDM